MTFNMRKGYLNTISTQIMPGDRLDLAMVLVDQQGNAIDFVEGVEIKPTQLVYASNQGGWRVMYEYPDSHIVMVDARKGWITINMEPGVLINQTGYQYILRVKDVGVSDDMYKVLARGNIDIINQLVDFAAL